MSKLDNFTVNGSKKIKLDDFPTSVNFSDEEKSKILTKTIENQQLMSVYQDKLYSEGKESIVVVLQAMDAAGKDGTIKHVMSGLNPQGIDVHSFKSPNSTELAHSYLWRVIRNMPMRGKMAIFNRSYYEDVLVVKVHELYKSMNIADRCLKGNVIGRRYEEINNFEQYAYNNGCRVIKIFLHLSKSEQKKRFLERINNKSKNWKFSSADIKERQYWDNYQKAYEDAINATSTKDAPWYVIPADKKWYSRYLVSEAVLNTLKKIDPQYPVMPQNEEERLASCKEQLLNEK